MTQKDLLYLEDAIGHEKNLVQICSYYEEIVEDQELKNLVKKQIKKHQDLTEKLLKVMEETANE